MHRAMPKPAIRIQCVFFLLFAFFGSASLVHAQDDSTPTLDPKQVAEDYLDAFDAFIDDDEAMRFEYSPEVDPNLSEQDAQLQSFMFTVFQFAAAETNAYFAELESVQFMNLLESERLKGDPDYSESRVILAESRRVIDKYSKRSGLLIGKFRSAVDQLDLSAEEKAAVRAGMMGGIQAGLERRERIWELEKESVGSFEAIIDLLETSDWVWDGDFINFADDADADQFDAHLNRVMELGEQQQQIQREALGEQ